ncbi:MAG TPA: sugar ABC transporter permease [Spirochaetota bacterium]|nr:sugar ABC transporter permease [Spirochaetota bacterium]
MNNKINRSGYFSKGLFSRNSLTAFAFLAIPLAVYTIFVIYPVLQAIWFSMFKWDGLGPMTDFVGAKNFLKIFADPVFRIAIGNNFKIVFLSLFIQLPLALFIALIIARKFKGAVVYRAIFFLPYILSEVIAGVLWSFIYNPQFGIQNTILVKWIPFLADFPFLGSPTTVFYSIFFVMIWKYFGLHMVLYIAGLQNIPQEIEEAARLDGVNWWQMNLHIILPLLKPTIFLSIFFSIVGSFQTFDIVWAMGKGEPVNAAETMVTYMYKFGFQRFQLGYGSAVAIVIFLITLIVGLVYQKLTASKDI